MTTAFGTPVPISVSTWSVSAIRRAMRAHEGGDFALSGALADHIRSDDRVQMALESRTLGVLGLPFVMQPGPSRRKKDAAAVAASAAASWADLSPDDAIADAVDWFHIMGFAVMELGWAHDAERDEVLPTDVVVHHPSFTRWNPATSRFAVFTAAGWEEVTPGDGRWVLLAKKRSRPWMAGTLRALAIPTILRGLCRLDWAARAEFEATGIKKASVPEKADEKVLAKFLAEVRRIGARGTLRLPPGFDFDVVKVDAAATQVFQALIEHCEKAITLAVLGQNLTSQNEGGSYAAAGVHAKVLLDRIKADVAALRRTLGAQVLRPWASYNVEGADTSLVPVPTWDTTPPEDLQKIGQAFVNAAQAVRGLREQSVDVTPILQKFGLQRLQVTEDARPPVFAYHIAAGVLTINEVRATLGLAPVEWGDERTGSTAPPTVTPESPPLSADAQNDTASFTP